VYNATNNELVRTKTLVKGAIIQIDASPFRRWYENHYAIALGRKGAATSKALTKKRSFKLKVLLLPTDHSFNPQPSHIT
jgi:small subunit ribosomal protein S8e